MKRIGITGVMGAGKSSVIAILKEQGFTVLDCDRINDELLMKEQAGYCALCKEFGNEILDDNQEIDRYQMSQYIFSNPQKKQLAEGILHPLIKAEISQQIQSHMQEKLVFVEVPLLYEVGWERFFDEVWVVAIDEELLLKRLSMYRDVSTIEAKRRLKHQITQDVKVKKADKVIWNNSHKENLKQQIYDILVKE